MRKRDLAREVRRLERDVRRIQTAVRRATAASLRRRGAEGAARIMAMSDEDVDRHARLMSGRVLDSDIVTPPPGVEFDPTFYMSWHDDWNDRLDPDEFMARPHVAEALRRYEARALRSTRTTTPRLRGTRPPTPRPTKGDDERGAKRKR